MLYVQYRPVHFERWNRCFWSRKEPPPTLNLWIYSISESNLTWDWLSLLNRSESWIWKLWSIGEWTAYSAVLCCWKVFFFLFCFFQWTQARLGMFWCLGQNIIVDKNKAASLWVMLNCLLLSSKWISITHHPNTTGFASLSLSPNNKTHPHYVRPIVFPIWPHSQCLSATCTPTNQKKKQKENESVPLTAPTGSHPVCILSLSPRWVPTLLLYHSLFLFSKAHQDPGLWVEQRIPAKAATLHQPQ